jgi:hypothetical protein
MDVVAVSVYHFEPGFQRLLVVSSSWIFGRD